MKLLNKGSERVAEALEEFIIRACSDKATPAELAVLAEVAKAYTALVA